MSAPAIGCVLRRISLHIGLPHAGSTSIQTCLKQSRAELREAGVLYPLSLGKRGQGSLVSYALEASSIDSRRRRMGLPDGRAVRAFRRELESAFAAELDASPARHVVLSAEQLSWELRSRREVERLAAFLRRQGTVDRVVIYLRPQQDVWISHHVNGVKRGRGSIALLLGSLTSLRRLDYRRTLDLWSGVFGESTMRVRILDASELLGGDLYDDFAAAMDIPGEALAVRPPPQNEGLGTEAVAFLRRINAERETSGGRMSSSDKAMVKALKRMQAGPKLAAPAWQLGLIARLFTTANREIARRYFSRDGALFRDGGTKDRAFAKPMSDAEAAAFAARLQAAESPAEPVQSDRAGRRDVQ